MATSGDLRNPRSGDGPTSSSELDARGAAKPAAGLESAPIHRAREADHTNRDTLRSLSVTGPLHPQPEADAQPSAVLLQTPSQSPQSFMLVESFIGRDGKPQSSIMVESFTGLQLTPGCGMVDTGAEHAVVGAR